MAECPCPPEPPGNNSRVSVNQTPTEAMNFLQELANNDAIRREFERNPTEVLAEHNIIVPPGLIEGPITLPSKEEMNRIIGQVALGGNICIGTNPSAAAVHVIFLAFFAFFHKASVRA